MFNSLKAKIIILYLGGLLLTLSLFLAIFSLAAYENEHETHSIEAAVIAERVKSQTESLYSLGLSPDELIGYERLLEEAIAGSETSTYIALSDPRGTIFYEFGILPENVHRHEISASQSFDSNHHLFVTPVEHPKGFKSAIVTVVDSSVEMEHVFQLILKMLAYIIPVSVIGGFLVMQFLKSQLVQPIHNLVEHINNTDLESFNSSNHSIYKRHDEIGGIAISFNKLIERLSQSQKAYKDSNEQLIELSRELDNRVQERTVELLKANAQLDELANSDSLSGLGNRHLFSELFLDRFSHCKRHQHNFSLLMIDLDNFKHINDTYGHSAGDFVIQSVGERLKHAFRGNDSVFRIGGDEFVLFFQEYGSSRDLKSMTQKLLSLILQPIIHDNVPLPVGASIGVASLERVDEIESDDFLKLADEAMYTAKKAGGGIVFSGEVAATYTEKGGSLSVS